MPAKSRPTLAPSSPRNSLRSLATRLTHLLALSDSASPNQLASRTKAPLDDIKSLLAEYAAPVGNSGGDDSQYKLTDAAYRDIVRPWEWRAYSPSERSNAIIRATDAFERLQIPKEDPVWLNLVEPRLRNSDPEDSSVPVLKLDEMPIPAPAPAVVPIPTVKETPIKRAGGAILKTKVSSTKKIKEESIKEQKDTAAKGQAKTKTRALKRERGREDTGASSDSDVDLMSRRKPENNKKRKISKPSTTNSAAITTTSTASEPMQRSRSESSSSGTKSPRKPSPLGASPPITAADLAEPKTLSSQSVDNYDEYELRKMAKRFKTLYEEYKKLYYEVKQYEAFKDGTIKKQVAISNEHQYLSRRDRLMKLHHKLEGWKTILWRAAPRFA